MRVLHHQKHRSSAFPDGSGVLPDGSGALPDGSDVFPDGSGVAERQPVRTVRISRWDQPPNHALQRTRPSPRGCNSHVSRAGSLSLGR